MRPLAPLLLLLALAAALCRAQAPSFAIGFSSNPYFDSVTSGKLYIPHGSSLPDPCTPYELFILTAPVFDQYPGIYVCLDAHYWQGTVPSWGTNDVVNETRPLNFEDSANEISWEDDGLGNVKAHYSLNSVMNALSLQDLTVAGQRVSAVVPLSCQFWVDQAGNDAWNGSSVYPWRTLGFAVSSIDGQCLLPGGAVLHVGVGNWSDNFNGPNLTSIAFVGNLERGSTLLYGNFLPGTGSTTVEFDFLQFKANQVWTFGGTSSVFMNEAGFAIITAYGSGGTFGLYSTTSTSGFATTDMNLVLSNYLAYGTQTTIASTRNITAQILGGSQLGALRCTAIGALHNAVTITSGSSVGTLTVNGTNALVTSCPGGFSADSLLNGGQYPKLTSGAPTVGYTPSVPSSWPSTPPTAIQAALDYLASASYSYVAPVSQAFGAVTANGRTGLLTFTSTLGAGVSATAVVSNNQMSATPSSVLISLESEGGSPFTDGVPYIVVSARSASTSFTLTLYNIGSSPLTGAFTVSFFLFN